MHTRERNCGWVRKRLWTGETSKGSACNQSQSFYWTPLNMQRSLREGPLGKCWGGVELYWRGWDFQPLLSFFCSRPLPLAVAEEVDAELARWWSPSGTFNVISTPPIHASMAGKSSDLEASPLVWTCSCIYFDSYSADGWKTRLCICRGSCPQPCNVCICKSTRKWCHPKRTRKSTD